MSLHFRFHFLFGLILDGKASKVLSGFFVHSDGVVCWVGGVHSSHLFFSFQGSALKEQG